MASFYVIRGKDHGQHFAVRGATATIGRDATNQIQLRDTEVSRRHAKIVRTGNAQFELVDNNSSNGTFINSRKIDSQMLRSGDRIQVGRTLMIFTGGPEPYSTRTFNDVEIVGSSQPDELSQIRSSIESKGSAYLDSSNVQPLDSVAAQDDDHKPLDNWEVVYLVSQAINRTTDLDDLLSQVLDLIFEWIECDRGCILMVDDLTNSLAPIANRDRKVDSASSSKSNPLTISRTILDHVVKSKEGVLTCDAQDDRRWQQAESVTSLGVHEAICVPMQGRYGLVGAIYIDTSTSAGVFAERAGKSSFDDQHLKLMIAIAGQAALAIEDTQFYRAMVQSERLAVMGQTIANLSHHVKNILQGVSGGNYLVEDGIKNNDMEVIQKGWNIVQKNQSRISTLVMDMLSFSKERDPNLSNQDLRVTVDEVIELTAPRAAEHEIQLQWNRPEDQLMAKYDAEAIHRAVLNVVSNAIDAVSEIDGTKQVHVELDHHDNTVAVVITDNGSGISEEDRARIFSPFESSKGSKGTGLGLPVSQKILREHGGDITLTSKVGEGSTFVLRWPGGLENPYLESGPVTQVN